MWTTILIGIMLISLSIFIHAVATRIVMFLAIKQSSMNHKSLHVNLRVFWISLIVMIMLCASLFEALFWAITYMILGAVEVFENALYFSIVTYTTLGYGDITLTENYRLLASLQAANGIIIFGWSTAITMAVVQKLYFKK
jgi:hypothetical protein